ncbi:MAG: hypothetical protein RIS70_1153 [Planctomycetota bacterium]|jgi:CheY-like chemotaxis protein
MNKSLRIAIADDEADMRMYLERILPRLGHEVVAVAANGQELVEQCLRVRPDLVISDERMPIMNGKEAGMKIVQEYPVRFIMISAYGGGATTAEAPHVLANLLKPVKLADIQAAISQALPEAC